MYVLWFGFSLLGRLRTFEAIEDVTAIAMATVHVFLKKWASHSDEAKWPYPVWN